MPDTAGTGTPQSLRSQFDPSPNAPRDPIRRKEPLLRFFEHQVFEEFALPAIALALGGSRRHANESLHLHDVWDERDHVLQLIHVGRTASAAYKLTMKGG